MFVLYPSECSIPAGALNIASKIVFSAIRYVCSPTKVAQSSSGSPCLSGPQARASLVAASPSRLHRHCAEPLVVGDVASDPVGVCTVGSGLV